MKCIEKEQLRSLTSEYTDIYNAVQSTESTVFTNTTNATRDNYIKLS